MRKETVLLQGENLIENKIRPLISRASASCENCTYGYGDEECTGCFSHQIISTLQQCEAFIGSVVLNCKLNRK